MLKDYSGEYQKKLRTPEEAVSVVKSGDWVDYTSTLGMPVLLDRALAGRVDELQDVKIRTVAISLYTFTGPLGNKYNLICAGVIISMIPAFIVFIICQKQIYSGITSGAVKG